MYCEQMQHFGEDSDSVLTEYARSSVMLGQWLAKRVHDPAVDRKPTAPATCSVLITHEFNAPLSHIDM